MPRRSKGSLLVFNALGWERDGLVPLAATPGGKVWTWVYGDGDITECLRAFRFYDWALIDYPHQR